MGLWGLVLLAIALNVPDGDGPWQPLRSTPARPEAARGGGENATPTPEADWMLETQARAALWLDAALTELRLEVTVRGGVASLFGPVPGEKERERAADVVRRVPGLLAVRNQARVQAPASPAEPRPRVFPPVDQPFRINPREAGEDAGTALPGSLMGRPSDAAETWQPTPDRIPMTTSAKPAELAPENTPLRFALSRLIEANARFRDVEFTLAGDRVRLRGFVAEEAILADLVRAISGLDGVEGVSSDEVIVRKRR